MTWAGVIRTGGQSWILQLMLLAALCPPACRSANPFFVAHQDAGTAADGAPAVDLAPGLEVPAAEAAPVDTAAQTAPDTSNDATSDLLVEAAPPPHGLLGEYFVGEDLQGKPAVSRPDQTINFSWKNERPADGVPEDGFSVRWTGWIEGRYNETYTFTTTTDDGVRLWIDGDNVIDSWSLQSGLDRVSMPVDLVPGVRRRITMEYYEHNFTATARLSWTSRSQAPEVVPFTQLWLP